MVRSSHELHSDALHSVHGDLTLSLNFYVPPMQ